ncbi:DUF4249 domain-containing protein [Flavobacterium sp.]|jgi:hypothetical protein|uniref:DUF4249 domain-containing protein n=1 Tax=Flavobacterium sp. TaxID=239 RepID=UPI0037BF00B5
MKATFQIICLLSIVFFSSCEDVIEVDLDTAPAKLVIDAALKWKKGTTGNQQTITLTTTTDFYATEVPPASGAIVFVTNENTVRFDFIETPGTGNYVCSNFIPEIGQTYVLTVIYQEQTYTATEQLVAVPQIDSVEQNDNAGLTGNEIEVKFLFQDPENTPNFYLIQFYTPYSVMPEYDVIDDAFFQGNQIFGLYASDRLKIGDEIQFTLHGISQRYYNYLNILLSVAGTNSGSPFQTPPATVRGNIINQTNFNNFALGFFSVSENDQQTYIIQ